MNIQDRQKTLTAEGLRQRYNLDGLDNDRKSIQLIKNSINKVETEFQNYMDIVNKSLGQYQDQVEITTWFSNDYPTFETPEDHLGDLYYDRENGKAYRYIYDEDNTEYIWQEIEIDKQVETLAIENSKADTSDDKRIVFVGTPTTPYTIGDVLIKNGTYYRCRAARESGDYSMTDWVIYTDYTDDMVMLDTRGEIDRLQTNVETNYVSTTQLETNTQGIYATVSATYATQTTVSTLDGEVQSSKEDIRQIDSRLSVEEGKITTLISDVGNRTGKTTSLTQDVDEIRAEISDIADITKSAEKYDAYIPDTEFQDIASSTPINVAIHPIEENILYLYPRDYFYPANQDFPAKEGLKPSNNLTPSNSLKPMDGYPAQKIPYLKTRTLIFKNTSTNEVFDYELPEDLLYYDANVYDIFTADYESRTIQVLKKCKYNADGTVSQLTPVETHTYNFDDFEEALPLTQGDYEVSILGYTIGYIKVRLMALNAYTAQYATKVELTSSITATAGKINLKVSEKITGFDENGNRTDDVISSINLAPGTATITADKVNINGVINAINNNTTTTIDGDKITTGTITANHLSSDSVDASKIVAGTITADKIANATITGSKLVNGTITGTQIADSTINNSKIANGTIENAKIKNGTIEGTKIKDATITSAKISSIDASKITTGTLTSREINNGNGTFSVSTSGVLTATAGTIGGWTLGTNRLYSGSGSTYVRLDSNQSVNTAIWCGAESSGDAPFRVTKAGRLTATDAVITGNITATSGTFTGGINATSGSITGASIAIQGGIGFLKMNSSATTNHPYVSALNISKGTNGISFRSGTSIGDTGSEVTSIEAGDNYLNIGIDSGLGIQLFARNNNGVRIISGTSGTYLTFDGSYITSSNNGRMFANYNCALQPVSGYYAYVGPTDDVRNRIATQALGPSSLNVKKNLVSLENEYDDLYKDIQHIGAYNYDYKYKNVKDDLTKDYGFIIDEIEDTKHLSKYFRNYKAKIWLDKDTLKRKSREDEDMSMYKELEIKEWDTGSYIKGLFVMIKALQHKIDELEEKINE